MKAIVLLNRQAGAAETEAEPIGDTIRYSLAKAGVHAEIRAVEGDGLQEAAKRAASEAVDAVIAAGGDGTLSAVADGLAGGDMPMGVMPVGTLNHFAKDNGIPATLAEAAEVVAARRVERLDVGRVNGRVFINNSSLGVYARALVDRDARRDLHGLSKWPAMALAMLKVFRRHPLLPVRINVDERMLARKTPLVFVGNNRYELELFSVGTRNCLNRGELSLYVANTSSRWGMFKLGVRAALGRLRQSRDFESRCGTAITVEGGHSRSVRVAVDGEALRLELPLVYEIWPAALPVIVPATKNDC